MQALGKHTQVVANGLIAFVWAFCILCSTSIQAQELGWEPLAPEKDAKILPDEFFVCVPVPEGFKERIDKYRLMLDDEEDLSPLIQWKGNMLTLFYPNTLPSNEHTVELWVRFRENKEWRPAVIWSFEVRNPRLERRAAKRAGKVAQPMQWEVRGRLWLQSREERITGNGSYLRQEWARTREFGLNTAPRFGKIEFPIELFLTTDQRAFAQTRNRIRAGIRAPKWEFLAGDHTLAFDKFILTGARVRGLSARMRLQKRNRLDLVYGNVLMPKNGQSRTWNPSTMPVLPNMLADSTVIQPGTYQRKLLAVRLTSFSRNKRESVGTSFVKSKDIMSSILYGDAPKENIAAGLDHKVFFISKHMLLHYGIGISATTHDIAGGAASWQEIMDTYGVDIKIEPTNYTKYFTVNASTYPLKKENPSSYYLFADSRLKIKSNVLRFGARKVGAGFRSFANPYLRTDRIGFYIRDRQYFWKRKMRLQGGYRYFEDNLESNQSNTRYNNLLNGQFFLAPSDNLPNFTLAYREQLRNRTTHFVTGEGGTDRLTNWLAGMGYRLKTKEYRHAANLTYNTSSRTDPAGRDNTQYDYYSMSISEYLPNGASIDLQYGWSNISQGEADFETNLYSAFLRWPVWQKRIMLTGYIGRNLNFLPEGGSAVRTHSYARGEYTFRKKLRGSIELGYAPFASATGLTNYTEGYVVTQLQYDFEYGN